MPDRPDRISQVMNNSPGAVQQLAVGSDTCQRSDSKTSPQDNEGRSKSTLDNLANTMTVADSSTNLWQKLNPFFSGISRWIGLL